MSWKTHINHISLKLSRNIGVLSRLRHCLPSTILVALYNSLIVPHFNYCNVIWGHTFKSYIDKIFLLQKRAIRIITKSDFRSSTDPLFAELNILPIHDLIKLHTLLSMFKLQNEKYPTIPGINFINN